MWVESYKSLNNLAICVDCYKKERMKLNQKWEEDRLQKEQQRQNRINENLNKFSGDAYTILYKYVERHFKNFDYPSGEQEKFLELIKVKYHINISKEDLEEVEEVIEEELEEKEKLRELDEFEKEILNKKEENKVTDETQKKEEQIKYYCSICNTIIDGNTYNFTEKHLGKPLCLIHQGSRYQRMLFEALKVHGIECEFEFYDGFKHVDIAIPKAKLYIEIDGIHHSTDANQLDKDLKRDDFSNKEGYQTKHYTNKELAENLSAITEALVKVIKERQK